MKGTLFFISIFIPLMVCGQSLRLFTSDKELSSSLVNVVYQDGNGMVWVLTEDGLSRYDGVKFTVYKSNPDEEGSLANNYVNALFEDRAGHLFVCSYSGVQMYDAGTDSFSPVARMTDGEAFNVTSIVQRRNGEIWVAGNRLCRLYIVGDKQLELEEIGLPFARTTSRRRFTVEAGRTVCSDTTRSRTVSSTFPAPTATSR